MRDRFGGPGADVAEVRRRLEVWREAQGGRGRRLPEDLWEVAVRLARAGDAFAVARALRLNPKSLSRRMARSGKRLVVRSRPPSFVEVAPIPEPAFVGGCRVELSGADGCKVSIQLASPGSVDLVALAGGLLRAGR